MKTLLLCGAAAIALMPSFASAQSAHDHNHDHHAHMDHGQMNHAEMSNIDHSAHHHSGLEAPAGIMGDHLHKQGEWMLSYRYMHMNMDGNRDGTDELSAREISGDFANNTGVGPATLRIVPTEMDMDMHMVSAMYGLTDDVTLMVMGSYHDKEMDHITFAGGDPDLEIGRFTTNTSGLGDTKVSGLFRAYEEGNHLVVAKAGLSLPSGSITETDTILNPMGAAQTVRLPYAMQLGSGTFDLEPAITYSGHADDFGWGAQYAAQIRLGENDENYTLGDKHTMNVWGAYRWNDMVQNSLRLSAEREGQIDGSDANIGGPVQTAQPENYGGDRVELSLGTTLSGQGDMAGHVIGAEFTAPLYQDLNGPQMQRDHSISVRYQRRF